MSREVVALELEQRRQGEPAVVVCQLPASGRCELDAGHRGFCRRTSLRLRRGRWGMLTEHYRDAGYWVEVDFVPHPPEVLEAAMQGLLG